MARFFISRQWRLARVVMVLLVLELPFTIANLALFGIAAPNLYRTILWAEGGQRGFNSDPSTVLYSYANYRPVKTPLVWSSFNTNYNLYIGVLCMFFYLLKCTGWLLHVMYPIFSLPLHIVLTTLWAYSLYVQTAPDTIDPTRENHGAPWYITKSCSIVQGPKVRGYCQQAKGAFAVSCVMLILYAIHIILAAVSLYPTAAARAAHEEKAAARRAENEKYANSPLADNEEMTAEQQWQHMWELQQLPRTPGTAQGLPGSGWGQGIKTPITPRTKAFGALEGHREVDEYYGGHGKPEVIGLGMDEYVPDAREKAHAL